MILNYLSQLKLTSIALEVLKHRLDEISFYFESSMTMPCDCLFLQLIYTHIIHFHHYWENSVIYPLLTTPVTTDCYIQDQMERLVKRPFLPAFTAIVKCKYLILIDEKINPILKSFYSI